MATSSAAGTSREGQLAGLVSWPIAAVAASWAATFVARSSSPVDAALPVLAVALVAIAALTRAELTVSVPLFLVVSLVISDEPLRLLLFGAILAATFCSGVALVELKGAFSSSRAMALTVIAVMLLRWIPIDGLLWSREIVLLILAAGITLIAGGGPFAIALAVATAFFTPLVPLRTFALPLAVAFVMAILRIVGLPRLRLAWLAAVVVAPLLLFFAWSGIAARALPLLATALPHQQQPRYEVNRALAAGASTRLEVPYGATALIVSGANIPQLERGAILGTIEPGGRKIVVGDCSDWGFLRLEHFHASRNPLPNDPAGVIHGYGHRAWIDASGRVSLRANAREFVVTAAESLEPGQSLQVEAFEMERK